MMPAKEGQPWTLTQLDVDCVDAEGQPRLAWYGIQYYNAPGATCCGGGPNSTAEVLSVTQHYRNLARGWPGVTMKEMSEKSSPWWQWRWYPGPFPGFAGVGSRRLLLGKPACKGCAGSNYLAPGEMVRAISTIVEGLEDDTFGGVFFWDLCRLFAASGPLCVNGRCQPSWNLGDAGEALGRLSSIMQSSTARMKI